MNDYDYSSTELLRLQTATQITSALIGSAKGLSDKQMQEIIKDAFIIANDLLEECKTPQDKKVKVPEGQNIYLIDGSFYYEYTNQEGEKVRVKLGE